MNCEFLYLASSPPHMDAALCPQAAVPRGAQSNERTLKKKAHLFFPKSQTLVFRKKRRQSDSFRTKVGKIK